MYKNQLWPFLHFLVPATQIERVMKIGVYLWFRIGSCKVWQVPGQPLIILKLIIFKSNIEDVEKHLCDSLTIKKTPRKNLSWKLKCKAIGIGINEFISCQINEVSTPTPVHHRMNTTVLGEDNSLITSPLPLKQIAFLLILFWVV